MAHTCYILHSCLGRSAKRSECGRPENPIISQGNGPTVSFMSIMTYIYIHYIYITIYIYTCMIMYDYVWLCNHTYSISAVIGYAICIFVGPWLKFTPHPLSPLVCFISMMLCPGDRVEISELRECQAKIPKNRIWIGDEYEPWYLRYPWVQLGVSNNTNVAGT